MPTRPIEDVLQDHTPELMQIPGVIGTAQGERHGKPVILILVEHDTAALRSKLPRELEGYPVEIVETGKVHSMDSGGSTP